MKKLLTYLLVLGALTGMYSCTKTFLQKPDVSGTTTLQTVYSSADNAFGAIMQCYRGTLNQGWSGGGLGFQYGTLAQISGERSRGYAWHGTYMIAATGLSASPSGDGTGSTDDFNANWTNIRANFLVSENIDQVPDMDATNKAYVKAEMAGLIAYRYMNMFIRYGGVPIITKSFLPTDDLAVPRSSLQETLTYTLQLCDQAIAGLPDKWPPNKNGADQTGRMTKGAAMAIKAKVLMYAARPLFNSADPYLAFAHPDLICFGSNDPTRWDAAITANEAVLTWATANGYHLINTGGGANVPNPNALDDYGNATSTPNNAEVLLAYKNDNSNQSEIGNSGAFMNCSDYWNFQYWDEDLVGMETNMLELYYKADGTDQTWPKLEVLTGSNGSNGGNTSALHPGQEFLTNAAQLEPRFHADNLGPGFAAANNPGDEHWSPDDWGHGLVNPVNMPGEGEVPISTVYGHGDSFPTKFYYHAGSRVWFEPPLFRLAETYLNLAEAYNERDQPMLALQNLNIVHNRAGLPSITVTDKTQLRAIIQREWAIEYYNESHRYFDAKHWKLPNVGSGIDGGLMRELQFTVAGKVNAQTAPVIATSYYYDAGVYTAYWAPKMYLEPIPQAEVNKRIIVQNPGY